MSQLSDAIQAVADKQTALEANFATFKADFDRYVADQATKVGQPFTSSDLDALSALGARIDAVSGIVSTADAEAKQADQ